MTVMGWDVAGKSALKYEATDQVLAAELNGDTSGVSILNVGLREPQRSSGAHRATEQLGKRRRKPNRSCA